MGNIRRDVFPIMVSSPFRNECRPVQRTSRHQPTAPHNRNLCLLIDAPLYKLIMDLESLLVFPALENYMYLSYNEPQNWALFLQIHTGDFQIMNYQESRAYINDAQRYGSVLGLANMQELMKRLGNPQETLKIIHVAGTNGKGSVIAYLYNILSQAGYRVGRYVSPTLYSYRERMEVASEKVSREAFAGYLTMTANAIEEMTAEGLPHPTPFEIETAVAFLFFAQENCDFVLLEVGLGGDMDATNIITSPFLCILASISMDHMDFLGNTLAEIASKKAGIIKDGCPVITTAQKPEAEAVIRDVCEKMHTPFRKADGTEAVILEESPRGLVFSYKGEVYSVSLAGVCQRENAVLALEAAEILKEKGVVLTQEQIKRGLAQTSWNGRFTVIHQEPLMIVDGAHNPGAADVLAESIRHYFSDKTIYFIMGMFRDKDYDYVIQKTCSFAKKIITIETPDNPRALPAEELAEAVRRYHSDVQAAKTLEEAVEQAFAMAGREDLILAFGSLSFIGELTRIVKDQKG